MLHVHIIKAIVHILGQLHYYLLELTDILTFNAVLYSDLVGANLLLQLDVLLLQFERILLIITLLVLPLPIIVHHAIVHKRLELFASLHEGHPKMIAEDVHFLEKCVEDPGLVAWHLGLLLFLDQGRLLFQVLLAIVSSSTIFS